MFSGGIPVLAAAAGAIDEIWKTGQRKYERAQINAFIDDTPYLADHQRRFYKIYLAARYAAMFEPLSSL